MKRMLYRLSAALTLAVGVALASGANAKAPADSDPIVEKLRCTDGSVLVAEYTHRDGDGRGFNVVLRLRGKIYHLVAKEQTARRGVYINKKLKIVWSAHLVGGTGKLSIGKKKLECDTNEV